MCIMKTATTISCRLHNCTRDCIHGRGKKWRRAGSAWRAPCRGRTVQPSPRQCQVTVDSFAFIIHPIDVKRDVQRKYPLLGRILNERQINFFSTYFPPIYISEIEGITSAATGKQIRGWFVACPYTPRRMLELPEQTVYRKIIQTGRMAEKLGAQFVGWGARRANA